MDRPTLNTVTTLTLLLESHSSRGHIVEMTSILSLAIKSSQWLGMDRMGSAKDDQARWAMSSDPPPILLETSSLFGAVERGLKGYLSGGLQSA